MPLPASLMELRGTYERENKVRRVRLFGVSFALVGSSSSGDATPAPCLLWHGKDK